MKLYFLFLVFLKNLQVKSAAFPDDILSALNSK